MNDIPFDPGESSQLSIYSMKPRIARTTPGGDGLRSCPDIFEPSIRESLSGKQADNDIHIINSIVKDAKNIHKQIREPIIGTVTHFQRLRDVREAQKLAIQNIEPQEKSCGKMLKDASIQTQVESYATVANGSKKRLTSSPPESVLREKKTREGVEVTESDMEEQQEWHIQEHRKDKKENQWSKETGK